MSEIKKLAIIRTSKDPSCPFGLPIPFACRNCGNTIHKMAPISVLGDEPSFSEVKQLAKANKMVLSMDADGGRCPFAGKLFKEKKAVECNFGSHDQGISDKGLQPSPFYSKVYDNIAYDGLYSYPMGWYGDNNISKNLYYGEYSLQGSDDSSSLQKLAFTVEDDIKDAVEHAISQEGDTSATGTFCYQMAGPTEMSLKEILSWDDYSSWGEFDLGSLKNLSKEELSEELNSFRPGYSTQALKWLEEGKIPPIVLVSTKDAGPMVGDGRGRVNLAMGLALKSLPVIILTESDDGNVCFNFENGRIKTAGNVLDMEQTE